MTVEINFNISRKSSIYHTFSQINNLPSPFFQYIFLYFLFILKQAQKTSCGVIIIFRGHTKWEQTSNITHTGVCVELLHNKKYLKNI